MIQEIKYWLNLSLQAVALLALGMTVGAGYVYSDAINNKAAYFHPHKLAIVWGQPEMGIILDAMPDVQARTAKKGAAK